MSHLNIAIKHLFEAPQTSRGRKAERIHLTPIVTQPSEGKYQLKENTSSSVMLI